MPILFVTLQCQTLKHCIMSKSEFNRNFSLSLDGKFAGLDRVCNKSLFFHKLNKKLNRRSKYSAPLGDKISFKVGNQSCQLYFR